MEQLQVIFAGSPEYFQTRGGSTNAGFLDALYLDGLGRAVDAGGRAAWSQALANGASRTQVADEIFSSPESKSGMVNNYYESFLRTAGRPRRLE